MFKRVRRRIEKSEKARNLGLTPDVNADLGLNDTDSDESVSESGSEPSGSERPSRKRKRPFDDDGEAGDSGQSDSRGNASEDEEEGDSAAEAGGVDDRTGAEGGPTVEDALRDPLFFVSEDLRACAVCPGKLLKNQHMAELHTEATHHIRRYTRFKLTVETLSTRFDDTNSDFASNVVRVMDLVQQSKVVAVSREQSELSKRASKKLKLARKRERQHKKKNSQGKAKESQPPKAKEITPGPKKSLKRRKLESTEVPNSEPKPKASLPSGTAKPRRSTTHDSKTTAPVVI